MGFHGGALLVNYPFDGYEGSIYSGEAKENPTLDDDVFKYIAAKYSSNHLTMNISTCHNHKFTNGITNGGCYLKLLQCLNYLDEWKKIFFFAIFPKLNKI